MPVVYGYWSARTRTAITISSKDALPARSPIPLMVHSTWRAPLATAASEFATASPRSLWQCAEMTTPLAPRTRCADVANQFAEFGRDGVADGVGNVERGGAGFDDGFENLEQKFRVGAGGVFGRKFDVVAECPRQADRVARLLKACCREIRSLCCK